MFSYKYPYTVFQKSTATGPSSTISEAEKVEKTTEQIQSNNEKVDKQRQERRQQADKQAVAKSSNPEKAQTKLNILNTEVETSRGTMKVDDILHITPNEERMKVIQSIQSRSMKLEIFALTQKSTEKQNQETVKDEEQKSEEDKITETEKNQTETEKNQTNADLQKALESQNRLVSGFVSQAESLIPAGKKSDYESAVQNAKKVGSKEFNFVKRKLKTNDDSVVQNAIESGKANNIIKAQVIIYNRTKFQPTDPSKQETYNRAVEQMSKLTGIHSATQKNTQAIVQSVVLGSGRERITNQAMAVVESGNYSTVQYNEGSEEIVFESKSGNGRYIIDTGVVPAVSRFERDGIQIEQPAKEPSPEDEKRADLTDEVYELEREAINQKGKINTLDTNNIAVQKALGRADAESPSPLKRVGNMYEEAQQKFLKESGDDNKPKPTKQKIQEAEKLLQLGSDLANAEKQDVASKIVDNINASMFGTQNDLPLENSLGKQKLSLRQHIDTLKKLDGKIKPKNLTNQKGGFTLGEIFFTTNLYIFP